MKGYEHLTMFRIRTQEESIIIFVNIDLVFTTQNSVASCSRGPTEPVEGRPSRFHSAA